MTNQKYCATQHSMHVWLLGRSSCSSSTTNLKLFYYRLLLLSITKSYQKSLCQTHLWCYVQSAIRTICGQSYKHFTILINDPKVVTWAIFLSYNSSVVNYDRKVLYKIDHRGQSIILPIKWNKLSIMTYCILTSGQSYKKNYARNLRL